MSEQVPALPSPPCTLPSAEAACRIVHGDLGGVLPAVGWSLVRAGAIGAGLYAVGERTGIVRKSLAASLAV
jgi:hypothetical protein